MTGLEMQTSLKDKLNDKASAWKDAQYLTAINDGIKYCVNVRAEAKDPNFLLPLSIVNGQDEPADFISFAGTIPIEVRDLGSAGRKWYYTGSTMPSVKYYRMRPLLTALSDIIVMSYSHMAAVENYALYKLEQSRGTLTEQAKQAKADCDFSLGLKVVVEK